MENENQTELEPMESEVKSIKQWFQDNLRIIVSVLIVVAIAAGIYSYSNRTEVAVSDQVAWESSDEGITSEEATEEETTAPGQAEAAKPAATTAPIAVSQETDNSFVETAGAGDGATHLARRALANYLEKNPDAALSAEHKIYIEDFLRKNSPKKSIHAGTSMEFSKDLIQNAITKSKTLNEKQLNNLKKYSARVPSLS